MSSCLGRLCSGYLIPWQNRVRSDHARGLLRGLAVVFLSGGMIGQAAEPTTVPAGNTAQQDRPQTMAAAGAAAGQRMGAMQRALLEYIYSIPLKAARPLWLDNYPDPDAKNVKNAKSARVISGTKVQATETSSPTASPADESVDPDSFVENDRPDTTAGVGAYGNGCDISPPRRLSTHEREWSNYRYFDGRPGSYGYGQADWGVDDASGEIYRYGFLRGRDRARFERQSTQRQEAVLSHAAGHLANGIRQFGLGRYQQAADAFMLAAETDQGDPTSRVYAGHALFAMGRYHNAVAYLRRAMELQPKIVYLSYDMRDDYGTLADFDQQLADLIKAVDLAPRDMDRLMMLGYVQYYSNQRREAFATLLRAAQVDSTDRLVERLMNNCQPPDVEADRMRTSDVPTTASPADCSHEQ